MDEIISISILGEINLFWIRSNNKFNGSLGDVLFLKILKNSFFLLLFVVALKKDLPFDVFYNKMPILLSVILFAFRSLFLPGIGVSDTLESLVSQEQEQISSEINESQLHSIFLEDSFLDLLLIENQEQEEKSETEDLPLLYYVETATFSDSKKDFTDWQTSFFSSKAKQGCIHFYDLFGCWKSELV